MAHGSCAVGTVALGACTQPAEPGNRARGLQGEKGADSMPKVNASAGAAAWSAAVVIGAGTAAVLMGAGTLIGVARIVGARADASAIRLLVGVLQGVALTIPALQGAALTRFVGVLQGVALM